MKSRYLTIFNLVAAVKTKITSLLRNTRIYDGRKCDKAYLVIIELRNTFLRLTAPSIELTGRQIYVGVCQFT